MRLLIGLGNPGPKYESSRHNAGWWILDSILKESKMEWDAATSGKFQGIAAKGKVSGIDVICLKPTTFMNLSGRSVLTVAQFFKVPSSEWIVFHDDIDLPDGKVKARVGGGHGGHNGVRSIIAETGKDDFKRIKLGVGRPDRSEDGQSAVGVADYVLQRVSDSEVTGYVDKVMPEVWLRLKDFLR